MKRVNVLLGVIVLTALACSLPAQFYPSFSIQMTTPRTSKYIWPAGQMLVLAASGVEDAGGHATNIIFYVNGRSIGSSSVSRSTAPFDIPRVSGTTNWTPTTAGEYFVQAQLQRSSGPTATSPAVDVCVIDLGHLAASTPLYLWGDGFNVPCTVSAAPAVPRGTSTAVSLHATANPVSLAYINDSCPAPIAPTVTFTAMINDPSGRVAFVTVRLASAASAGYFDSIFLTQSAGGPTGMRTFSGVYGDGAIDINLNRAFHAGPGTLTWEARAISGTGALLAHEDHTMLVGPCQPPVAPLTFVSPTPTVAGILTIITPTFTPASALDCPAGTYYADATHQCILIPSATTAAGGASQSCSKITSSAICGSTPGCYFDFVAKTCKKK